MLEQAVVGHLPGQLAQGRQAQVHRRRRQVLLEHANVPQVGNLMIRSRPSIWGPTLVSTRAKYDEELEIWR